MKVMKSTKQLTFDSLPTKAIKETRIAPKQIIITQMEAQTREYELTLKIAFKIQPSKTVFSRVKADLLFNGKLVDSVVLRILQGSLATDECEYISVLDMKGIAKGTYALKSELYEQGQSAERNCETSKEITLEYVPQTREERLIKIPSVKSTAGADLTVATKADTEIIDEIEDKLRKEQLSRRDNW